VGPIGVEVIDVAVCSLENATTAGSDGKRRVDIPTAVFGCPVSYW
jgi:hypothetical protein